ncbi:MAG: SCO family protein [Ignavibacteria bacterium]|nr:SCO family protein [Ignavibacteria bacterium]
MKRAIIYSSIMALILFSCGKDFSVIEDLSGEKYSLIDQDEKEVYFPGFVKGQTVVAGYIFTNCPDICPLTTNNMRLIQERLKKDEVTNVQLVSISFDPENDSPEVLKKFAEIRNLDLSNWTFLTGAKPVIDKLMKHIGVVAVPGDSTVFPSGKVTYYYVHTDRIQLIDGEGRIRKNYPGSSINIDEIIEDIKSL